MSDCPQAKEVFPRFGLAAHLKALRRSSPQLTPDDPRQSTLMDVQFSLQG